MKERTDIYERVTSKIIELLEQAQKPDFVKPWIDLSDGGPARNPVSGTTYTGINQFLLSLTMADREYSFNRWVTFKQAKAGKAKVQKGAKGTEIVYLNYQYFREDGTKVPYKQGQRMTPEQREAQGIEKRPYLKGYYVFNLQDVQGLPDEMYHKAEPEHLEAWEKDTAAEALLSASGAAIKYKKGAGAAYYPKKDEIILPDREQFKGKEPFYEVAFHELAHWTAHPDRLNRPLTNKFGSPEYAQEELIAEFTTAYICASLGFESQIPNNGAYINNWLGALKEDKRYIFKVTGSAQRAADYIHEKAQALQAAA